MQDFYLSRWSTLQHLFSTQDIYTLLRFAYGLSLQVVVLLVCGKAFAHVLNTRCLRTPEADAGDLAPSPIYCLRVSFKLHLATLHLMDCADALILIVAHRAYWLSVVAAVGT